MDKDKVLKKNYEELLDREKRLRRILETTQDGFFIFDKNQKIIDVNDAYCEMSGYKREEILNLNILDIDAYKSSEKIEKVKETLLNKGHDLFETKHVKKNGEVFDVEVSISLLKQRSVEALCFCRDITEKKKDQQNIIDMKERLENIIEGNNVGTWEWNIKKNNIIVNSKYTEMLGYKLEEISTRDIENIETWEKLLHSDDLKRYQKKISKIWNKEIEYYDIEIRVKHKNGKWKWINSRGKVTKWSEDGTPVIMSGTHMDITDKKKDQQNIIEMKERLENIIEGNNVGTWEWHIQKGEIDINHKWAEMLGYSLEEISPVNFKTWETLIHPDDLKKAEKELQKVINKEIEYYDCDFRMEHKTGKWIWISDRGKVTKWSEDGEAILMSGTHTDFTEKKQKQEQIEYLSFHDSLTGLYNRRYMEDSIKRLDTDRNIPFSIIAADVDGLKLTNDAYGHEMGDKLLITAAEILKKSCRKEDIICRISGDEFAILLPNIDSNKVKEIIERIKEESENTELETIIVSISTGYSTKNKKEKNILEVYKEADNNMYKNKLKYGRIMRNKTIERVLENVNKRYENEKFHMERVSQYCESIAKAMNLGEKEIEDAKIAGKLHDIGKIAVNPKAFKKENKLTSEEWEEVKKHSSISYQLLKSVDEYTHLAQAVLYHHERLDCSGYPEGLKEDKIPLLSKIIAVADSYESMIADSLYKNKKTKAEAVEELKKQSGIKFDKYIVDVFINKVL